MVSAAHFGNPNVEAIHNSPPIKPKTSWWTKKWGHTAFRALMIVVSVALVTLSLLQLMNGQYESGQWDLVNQIVFQILGVVTEVLALTAVKGALACFSSFAGPIIAFLGLVFSIVTALILKAKREPSAAEAWVKETGKS
ncbi:hypothetical protein N7493_001181 [Penicillium malachiteum]|uniref:Uncharacterized protein n=1 Tax=Penicillium malachiteum TaxID=1324776 RepID=A0AAD6HU10_9EURO|nr:hypothetical protein N7493_001181 [Penicillium malachiteum]